MEPNPLFSNNLISVESAMATSLRIFTWEIVTTSL